MIVGDDLDEPGLGDWNPQPQEELSKQYWEIADVNDLSAAMLEYAPRGVWFEVSGDPDGLCYVPCLCLCVLLSVSFARLKKILAPNWGQYVTIVGMEGGKKRLTRAKGVQQPVFWRLSPLSDEIDVYYDSCSGPGEP